MTKDIIQKEGTYKIIVIDEISYLDYYKKNYSESPIKLEFFPSIEMNENQCLNYIEKNLNKLKSVINNIIKENYNFYKYFDKKISIDNGHSLGIIRNNNYPQKTTIGSLELYIKCSYTTDRKSVV